MSDLDDMWITVPGWDKFQHYKDRTPAWIKLYTELNSRDEWLTLTTAERGMLVTIWVEYARSCAHLRVRKVMQLCGKSARSKHLASLNHAGFIRLSASAPLAQRREEKKREERAGRSRAKTKTADPVAKANVQPVDPVQAIAAMIRNGVIHDTIDLEAEVRGYHLAPDLAAELRAMLP